MPTLRRILKYTPAVVTGLLVVAWLASLVSQFGMIAPSPDGWGQIFFGCADGAVAFQSSGSVFEAGPFLHFASPEFYLGSFDAHWDGWIHPVPNCGLKLPILAVVMALTPLAIGPFISFRFRLWHYLAYTALVAVELAYYLRWQG